MTTTPPQVAIRLRKAATDAGFDLDLPPVDNWLGFATTRSPVRIWLTAYGETVFVAAISQRKVSDALATHGAAHLSPLPDGAAGGRCVTSIDAVGELLYRVIPLARTLPDELLHVFQARAASLPRTTEAERLVVQRVGQDVFRAGLLEYWQGRCPLTGLAVASLLRASHIKRWADCQTDAERLDIFNGLLLAPHLDAAFDGGWITFDDDGHMRVSQRLDEQARASLGLSKPLRLVGLTPRHCTYLEWHRQYFSSKDAP